MWEVIIDYQLAMQLTALSKHMTALLEYLNLVQDYVASACSTRTPTPHSYHTTMFICVYHYS